MSTLLIALSERDKRVILMLFLLIIVLIALFAVIGAIITRIMKWQGKKMDELTHDVVVTGVIENKKQFIRYARIKNWRTFFVQAWIPIVIMVASTLVLIIRNAATNDWSYNLVDHEKTGFSTLFFIFDFNDESIYAKFFGIRLLADWPKVISAPHFSIEAWASYIFFFGMLVGGTWYLVTLQCLISRTIQMYRLSHSIYKKSLEGFSAYENESSK